VDLTSIKYNEFDYLALQEALRDYKYPKDKITKLLRKEEILQLKKGLYIKNDTSNYIISEKIAANLLYGPSYISLEYALSYYNLIPERVEAITSVTTKRKKTFNTPIGTFLYYSVQMKYYSFGVKWLREKNKRGYFIASPEKAVIDKLYFENAFHSQNDMRIYLLENLRIDKAKLKELNDVLIENIIEVYKKKSLANLLKVIKKL
jgi:hypothetical protein